MAHFASIVAAAVEQSWSRRAEWDERRRRRRMLPSMPPGDMSGAEPREHWPDCRVNCDWAHDRSEDFAFYPIGSDEVLFICPTLHEDHTCNCDEIAQEHAESLAEAAAEHLAELDQPAVGPV